MIQHGSARQDIKSYRQCQIYEARNVNLTNY